MDYYVFNNLSILLNEHKAFIAADHFWYPVEGNPGIVVAPDIMVVMNRPDHHRGSYKQWEEEDTPPDLVIEIRSPSHTEPEMKAKHKFYEKFGVKEYLDIDPDTSQFSAYERISEKLVAKNSTQNTWESPLLRFILAKKGKELTVKFPNGEDFKTAEQWYQLSVNLKTKNSYLISENSSLGEKNNLLETENDSLKSANRTLKEEMEKLKAKLKDLGEDI